MVWKSGGRKKNEKGSCDDCLNSRIVVFVKDRPRTPLIRTTCVHYGVGKGEAQQRIRLGDPVILSRTGTRDQDLDLDPGTGGPGLFSAVGGGREWIFCQQRFSYFAFSSWFFFPLRIFILSELG